MTDIDPKLQAGKLFDNYLSGIYDTCEVVGLENWTTDDLVRLYHLIDVELQERAFNAQFQSPFDEIGDDFGPSDEY